MFFRLVVLFGVTAIVLPTVNTVGQLFNSLVPWIVCGVMLGILLYRVTESEFLVIVQETRTKSLSWVKGAVYIVLSIVLYFCWERPVVWCCSCFQENLQTEGLGALCYCVFGTLALCHMGELLYANGSPLE